MDKQRNQRQGEKRQIPAKNSGNTRNRDVVVTQRGTTDAKKVVRKAPTQSAKTRAAEKKRKELLKRAGELRAVRAPKIVTLRKKERSPFPVAMVFTSVIVTVLFLFMMMNYAEINRYNKEINALDNKITQLQSQENLLRQKLDKKDNLVDIEKFAKEELGMVKSDTLKRNYVKLLPEDKAEIIRYDDGKEGGFGFLLAGIGEVLGGFWD